MLGSNYLEYVLKNMLLGVVLLLHTFYFCLVEVRAEKYLNSWVEFLVTVITFTEWRTNKHIFGSVPSWAHLDINIKLIFKVPLLKSLPFCSLGGGGDPNPFSAVEVTFFL